MQKTHQVRANGRYVGDNEQRLASQLDSIQRSTLVSPLEIAQRLKAVQRAAQDIMAKSFLYSPAEEEDDMHDDEVSSDTRWERVSSSTLKSFSEMMDERTKALQVLSKALKRDRQDIEVVRKGLGLK